MKLISEVVEELQYLTEENKPGQKEYYIKGVFLQADRKNRNGRSYPKDIMAREVNRYTQNYIDQNRAYGELGHPDTPTINLDRVSHLTKELKESGNDYIGKAKILDTPYGKIVKSLIDEGAKLGVSSRGLGSLTRIDGVDVVGNDFFLATAADIVADPSAPDAFVRGICEGKEWIFESGTFTEIDAEKVKKSLYEAHRRDYENIAIRAFQRFMSKL